MILFLVKYQLTKKIIDYVKDEGTNLNTLVVHSNLLPLVHYCKLHHNLLSLVLGILCLRHVNMSQMKQHVGWDEGGEFDES
jgi:hypothetical protein